MDTAWFKTRKKEVGATDADLAAAINRERSVANKLVTGKLPFDLKYVDGFVAVLRVSREELLQRVGVLSTDEVAAPASNGEVLALEGASLDRSRENLPVYGTGLGAPRDFEGEAIEQTTLNRGDIVEYVKRPLLLNDKPEAYALYVQGSSMHPALPDGEMVAAIARAPLSTGDNVVVYLRPAEADDDDGLTARAVLIKELVRRTASYVQLRQYQPAMDFRIEMKDVLRIDRILSRREMLS